MAGKERVDGSFQSAINYGRIVVLHPDYLPGCQLEVNGHCTCRHIVFVGIKVEVPLFIQQPEMSTALIASLGHRKPKDKIDNYGFTIELFRPSDAYHRAWKWVLDPFTSVNIDAEADAVTRCKHILTIFWKAALT